MVKLFLLWPNIQRSLRYFKTFPTHKKIKYKYLKGRNVKRNLLLVLVSFSCITAHQWHVDESQSDQRKEIWMAWGTFVGLKQVTNLPSDHFVSGNSRLFWYFHLSCSYLFFTARFLSSTDFGLKRGWFKPRITQLLFV